MDPVPSRPSRRYRNVFGIDIPIIECKREFSLPHKFPSMVNSLKNKCMLKDYKTVTIANPEVSNSLNESKSKKILSTNTIQKLRIKTKDGKDLGEVKHWDDNGLLNIHRAVIEAGAKPVLSDLLHDSAVILASKLSSPFLVDLLNYVTEPKLLNHVDLSGMAPLHYCALNGYLSGVNALIKMGADVNLQDNHSGRTPFFHALENEHTPVAQKLLEYNAIADLPNFSGQSVMSLVDEAKSLSLKVAFN
ncbi:BCL-6 corepressor [Eufriesea mexicana]|uniref:BCL-6 corepressor n=1 Tax=Eufriesea mexicana TaxID=516756 RepID=A0A310SGJ1_9HYME|nr:BCL-6 corepressor [Eufriesea mexicana]